MPFLIKSVLLLMITKGIEVSGSNDADVSDALAVIAFVCPFPLYI